MPRFGHVVLGGTFDRFHVGHQALLSTAFRSGRRVSIGITTDRFLAAHPKPRSETIQPYSARSRAVRRWIRSNYPDRRWRAVPLNDGVGGSAAADVDALVVSADTVAGGAAVNAVRRRLGRPPVPLVIVPLVLGQDLLPVSSRRIRWGEIDPSGRRRGPISIGVGLESDGDRPAVAAALRRAFPRGRVRFVRGAGPARATATRRARRLADRAVRRRSLAFGVARSTPPEGWVVVERSSAVALDPRRVPGASLSALRESVYRLARPSRPKSL